MENNFSERIDGVIFDVDGVLLDSMPVWHDCGRIYLRKKGIDSPENLGDILFSMTLEEGARYIKEHFGLDENIEEISQGIMDVVEGFYFNLPVAKEGAVQLVKGLKEQGKKISVVSSTRSYCLKEAFRHLGIDGCFDVIVSCSENGRRSKEYPDAFFEVSEIMGTDPNRTWVIEDGLYSIKTAKEAGFKTVGIYDEVSKKDRKQMIELTDLYVDDPNQLAKIFFAKKEK